MAKEPKIPENPKVYPKIEGQLLKNNEKDVIVTYPNGETQQFVTEKNVKGQLLFDAICKEIKLAEKDYFGLQFFDPIGEKDWLDLDKKILKQIKTHDWNFNFCVKFFVPEPNVLLDDKTRDLYYQQIRHDIYDGRLPASYPTHVLLAAMAMQVHGGDLEKSQNDEAGYDNFVRNSHIIPNVDQEFISKVREAHKEQKGMTSQEACLKFLETVKKLAKYGYHFFQAKDSKNSPVTIGVNSQGIVVLKEDVRIHRFLWQSIDKILFRENKFTVIVKPGELDEKKSVSVHFKLVDYNTTNKLYRTAVEHHTFFRLIKSETPPKSQGLLRRWGSDRFRYSGRTFFQAKMANQMFDTSHPAASGRSASRSAEDLVRQKDFPTSPLHYADETTQQASSPEKSKSYSLKMSKAEKEKQKADELTQQNTSESNASKSSTDSLIQPLSSEFIVRPYSPRDPALTSPYEDFPLGLSTEERKKIYTTPQKTRLSKVKFAQDGSAVAIAPAVKPGKRNVRRRLFGPINDDHTRFSPVDDLILSPELFTVPINDLISTYDKGFYGEKMPSKTINEFSLICCKPTKTDISEKIRRNKNPYPETEYLLNKKLETEYFPVRYFVDVYHSGYSQMKNRRKKRLFKKDEDVVESNQLKKQYYDFSSEPFYNFERLEVSRDSDILPLKQYSNVYWFGGNSKPGKAKSTYEIPIEELRNEEQTVAKIEKVTPIEKNVISQVTVTTTLAEKTNEEKPSFVGMSVREGNENLAKIEELESFPLKKMVSVYHSGQSLEHISPVQWIRRQKDLLLKTRNSEEGSVPSTSSESVTKLKLGKRKQQFSLSDDYPAIVEPFKGELSEIRKQPDLPLFNLFDHVNFRPKEDSKLDVEPLAKKAKYNRRGQLCLWCGPGTKMTNDDEYPADVAVYTGKIDDFNKTNEVAKVELEECVDFQNSAKFDSEMIKVVSPESTTKQEIQQKQNEQFPILSQNITKEKQETVEFHVVKDYGEQTQKADPSLSKKQSESDAEQQKITQIRGKRKRKQRKTLTTEIFDNSVVENPEFSENLENNKNQLDEQIITEKQVEENILHKEREAPICDVFESKSTDDPRTIHTEKISSNFDNETEKSSKKTGRLLLKLKQDKEKRMQQHAKTGKTVQNRLSTYSISANYPELEETYQGKLYSLSPVNQIETVNIFDLINFVNKNNVKENAGKLKASKNFHLWCTSKPKTAELEENTFTFSKTVQNKKHDPKAKPLSVRERIVSTYSMSENYPEISAPFEGEVSVISPEKEIVENNLFDEVDFLIDDETKKFGIPQTWKFWRKSTKTEVEPKETKLETKVEKKKIPKAAAVRERILSTFSMSEHYPEITPKYEGELLTLSPVKNISDANLFDVIDFASDDDMDENRKSKASKKWNLLCGSKKQDSEENLSTPTVVHEKKIKRPKSVSDRERIVSTYSMSENYPEISAPFEGEVSVISPEKEIVENNLFDEVDFLIDDETKKFGIPQAWKFWHKSAKTEMEPKETQIQETKVEKKKIPKASAVRERILSTFSMSGHYPEITPKYEGELSSLSPVKNISDANLFDFIDFAPHEDSNEISKTKTPKSWNLWCASKPNSEEILLEETVQQKKRHPKAVSRLASARERLVSVYSMSTNYPEVSSSYEGEVFTLSPVKNIPETNLFDIIDFAFDEGTNELKEPHTSKKWKLWCISKQKVAKSEENLPEVASIPSKDERTLTAELEHANINVNQQSGDISKDYLIEVCLSRPAEKAAALKTPYQEELPVCERVELLVSQSTVPELISIDNSKTPEDLGDNTVIYTGFDKKGFPLLSKSFDGEIDNLLKTKEMTHSDISGHFDELIKVQQRKSNEKQVKMPDYPQISSPYSGELIMLKKNSEAPSNFISESVNFRKDDRKDGSHKLNANLHSIKRKRVALIETAQIINHPHSPPGYPKFEESFKGEIKLQSKAVEAPSENLFKYVLFDTSPMKKQKSAFSKVIQNFLPQKNLKGYPEMNDKYDGSIYSIYKQNEVPETDILQCVFFAPQEESEIEITSNDSGLGDETKSRFPFTCVGQERKSKKKRPTTQINIRKKRRKSKQYSLSENYPLIGIIHDTEIHELNRKSEIESTDLFETIKFSPRTETEKFNNDKKTKNWTMLCSSGKAKSKSEESLESLPIQQNQEQKKLALVRKRLVSTYSMSKHYPEEEPRYEGELHVLVPSKGISDFNLFDIIEFATDDDIGEPTKKQKDWNLFCLSKSKSKNDSVASSSENIEQKHQQPLKTKSGRDRLVSTFSTSKHYPEPEEKYEGELFELNPAIQIPEAKLFDIIDFVTDDDSANGKPQKSRNWALLCASKPKTANSEENLHPANIRAKHSKLSQKRKSSTYSISANYPEITPKYENELFALSPDKNIPEANILDIIDFVPAVKKSKSKSLSKQKLVQEKKQRKGSKLARERIVSTYSMSENYPEISAPFEGKVSVISPEKEIVENNLFDEVDFLIYDETKKFGIPQTWKFWRKSTKTEVEPKETKVQETKVEKKKIPKASAVRERILSTFSMSEHYPEITPKYEGELLTLSPVKNISDANLFDVIDFASDDDMEENRKSKASKKWNLLCASKKQDSEENLSTPTVVHEKKKKRPKSVSDRERIVSTYSMSENYPEISAPFEGEVSVISPEKEIVKNNLFDEVDFLIDDETKKFGIPQTWKFWRKSTKTEVEPKETKVQETKVEKKKIPKAAAVRERILSAYSMSENYPEITPKYEGELSSLSPVKGIPKENLFDVIDFAPDDNSEENTQAAKGWNLWCASKTVSTTSEKTISKKTSEKQSKQQKSDKQMRKRLVSTFSMSKHYPEPEEKYEGELFEVFLAKQMPESKLFDEVAFLTDDNDKLKKSRFSKNWNLCVSLPKEGKTEKSTVYQDLSPNPDTSRSSQRAQSPIGQFSLKRSVWSSKSKPLSLEGYPSIGAPFIGELNELSKVSELENSDLFESVTFLPKIEPTEIEIPKSDSQIKKKKLRLFAKKRLSKSGSVMDLTSYPKFLIYDGPLESLAKTGEVDNVPLKSEINKYHSGYSIPFGKPHFERCRFDGIEEIGEAGNYSVVDFGSENVVPIYPFAHETIPLRAFGLRPMMDKMPQAKTPKDARRAKSTKTYESDSDTSSQETEPSNPIPFVKSESFLKFIRNRLNTKNPTKKKTGFENLVEPFSAEYPEIKKQHDIGNHPILEHVHVYHNGQSTQQAIDSGFEEAGSADENKKVVTLYLKKSAKPSFLKKFKLNREFNEKTVDAPEQAENELDSSPFLGLCSTIPLQSDVEHVPLTSVVANLPIVTFYDKRSLASPVPIESDDNEQKLSAEFKIETKKPRKIKDLHGLYGLSWKKYEGPLFEFHRNKKEIIDFPVGEYATVYHCGRSDLPIQEIPDEFYQIPVVTDSEMKKSAILHLKPSNEPVVEQLINDEPIQITKKDESEGLKIHVNIFRSEFQEPNTSEIPIKQKFSERLASVFKKSMKNYPIIGESFDEEPVEIQRSLDLEDHKLCQFVTPYHFTVSKHEKQRKRKLKVNLKNYPFDPKPINENISDLMITKDLPKIPAPFFVGDDIFVEKPKKRISFRRFWQKKRIEEPFFISGINTRDDVSSTLFNTMITDRSLFVKGHWPVTDIDVDVVLKHVARVDCECEANIVLGKSYFDVVGGRKSFGPQGSSSIVQTNRGTSHAKASFLIREKIEPVEIARKAVEDFYFDSSFSSDIVLLEDDNNMRENYLRSLSPSTWRRKFMENGLCHSGSRSPTDSMAHSTTAVSPTNTGGMFASIKRRFSEKLAKKERKEKEKQKKKEKKEAKKKSKKNEIGYDVDSDSSSSASDAEIEERHVIVSQVVDGSEEFSKKTQELNFAGDEDYHRMAPQNAVGATRIDPNSGGPYTPAKEKDGRIIKEEREETVYKISGTGHAPKLDPNDMSLSSTVSKCMKQTDKVPRVQMVEASVLVTEHEPVPQAIKEGSAPFSTVHTWHETEAGPEQVFTEIDKYGNKVTKTVKTQTTKHTIQKQTYQTYAVDGNQPESITKIEESYTPLNNESIARSPVVNTHTRTIAYEKGSEPDRGNQPLGELVSSKTITTGNRTVEILTYKTEKDGVVETRVEHRVTIHSGDEIDHDAELAKALLEATKLSPDMYITQIEMDSSTQN